MYNMSYCRFSNTLGALRECVEALEDIKTYGGLSAMRDELESAKQRYENLEDAQTVAPLDALHRAMEKVVRLEEALLSKAEEEAAHELIQLAERLVNYYAEALD